MAIFSDIWDNDFDTDDGFSGFAVDKTKTSYRFRTSLSEKDLATGVVAFTLKNMSDEKTRGLLLQRRTALGLEDSPQQLVSVQGSDVQIQIKKTSASEFKVLFGDYLKIIGARADDGIVFEVFTLKRGVKEVKVHILPTAAINLDRQLRLLQRELESEAPVSSYWYFAEEFITALIRETVPSIANRRPDEQVGGVEVRPVHTDHEANTWVQWMWESEREITILIPPPADIDEVRAAALAVEYQLAGFERETQVDMWAMTMTINRSPNIVAKKIIHVLRVIFQVSVADNWKFVPFEHASNLLIRQNIPRWMAEGPSNVESQSEIMRELFEDGFQLPGPLLVPRWIQPFMAE